MFDCVAIKLLFEKNDLSDIKKYRLYIHAVIAHFVKNDSGYLSYRDAWESNRAQSYKKYLPEPLSTEHEDLVFCLCDYVADSDGVDFLTQITPELFPCDVSSLFTKHFKVGSRRSFIYALLKLYALYSFNFTLRRSNYLPSPHRFSKDELLDAIEVCLTQWIHYDLYKGIYDFYEDIQGLWVTVFGVLYSPNQIKATGIASIYKELSSLGLTNEEALELFYIAKVQKSFDLDQVGDPYSYFRSVMLKRINDSDWSNKPKEELTSPGQDFFLKEDLFNRILLKWKNLDTINFVKVTCYPKYSHNFSAETALAMPYLLRYCMLYGRCLVIDPNPDFILKFTETDNVDSSMVCFVMSSKTLAILYKQRFQDFSFAYIGQNERREPIIYSIDIDDDHYGRELRFKKPVAVAYKAGAALVFARNDTEENLVENLCSLADFFEDKGTVLLFCPNSLLDAKNRNIRHILAKKYDYLWIQILPTETSSAWLKKNVVVCLSTEQRSEPIRIFRSNVYNNLFEEQVICRDPWPVLVQKQLFLDNMKTVNRVWEQCRPKPESNKTRKTRRWVFSKEISLWYSWSNGRGKVQYYGTPTEKQIRENPLARGKKLTQYYAFTSKSVENAEEKFETAIWEEQFWPIISDEIKNSYKYRPITLKTFWFCNEDELRSKAGYNYDVAKQLFQIEKLAELMSDCEQSFEFFESIINDLYEKDKKENLAAWRTLNAIISLANQTGRFIPNMLSDHIVSLKEKNKGYLNVRKGLAKRSFEHEEEIKMLNKLRENVPNDGAFVGAAISFYTGVPVSQICALSWADYHKLFGNETYQLWVTKTLTKDGSVKDLSNEDKNMLRRVPVVESLSSILNERLELVERELGNTVSTDKKLLNLPICSKSDLMSRCSPADIRKAKDLLEIAAGIEPMEVSVEKEGTTATDLNDFAGDRFRANFYYRAMNTCCMSRAEANYIYGISLPTTFSKHYCDYTNDFAQLMLCRKLERWTSLHKQIENEEGIFEGTISATGKRINIEPNAFLRSSVELRMKVKTEDLADCSGEVIVSICDSRGVNVNIRKRGCKDE